MTFAILVAAASLLAAPDTADDFFAEFAKRRADIATLRANYTEKTVTPEEEFVTEGTLTYAKPRRIVRRTAPPDNVVILIDDRRCYQYEPEIKQLVIYELDNDPRANLLFLGFDSDIASLREAYDVSVFSIEDQASGKKGILIKPKAGDKEAWFKEVNLYLDEVDYLPYRIRMVNEDDSQLIIEVKDIKKNPPLDPADTQAAIAEGTKVIKDDEVLETVGSAGKLVPDAALTPALAPRPEAQAPSVPAPALVDVKPLENAPAGATKAP
jgi:outer membrane lipoprotein-sorting protein